ncbi:hypothetical protein AMTRI_Chr12g271270 [Amborella trichopoda]
MRASNFSTCFFFGPSSSSSAANPMTPPRPRPRPRPRPPPPPPPPPPPRLRPVRIAVVGDAHEFWDLREDGKAIGFLQADLILLTGDFGNENVELVKSIAELKAPKAAILGNHDAWYTQKFSETRLDGVRAQLESLGEAHVGYDRLDFPEIKISVVGGRPFSSGGGQLFRRKLLSSRYGVHDMKGSAKKICDAAQGTPDGHSIILLAHNGPTGLGSEMDDICGRDWVPGGGDHGDPDLAQAIADLKSNTRLSIPLVVFGHMHKNLQLRNGTRRMLVLGAEKTIYLNAAVVPRVRGLISKKGSGSTVHNDAHEVKSKGTIRQFSVVDILNGNLEKIADTWISVVGDSVALQAEDVLFRRQH